MAHRRKRRLYREATKKITGRKLTPADKKIIRKVVQPDDSHKKKRAKAKKRAASAKGHQPSRILSGRRSPLG